MGENNVQKIRSTLTTRIQQARKKNNAVKHRIPTTRRHTPLMKWHASTHYRRGELRVAKSSSTRSKKTASIYAYHAAAASAAAWPPLKRGLSAANSNYNHTAAPSSQR